MMILSDEQRHMKDRIKSAIDMEVGMCDDYRDLMILASILFDSSKTMFNAYSEKFGKEELSRVIVECSKMEK